MLYASIALFAIAAIFGLTILLKWVSQKTASSTIIYSHGFFAVIALVILIVYSVQNPDNFPKTSLILFGIAALGGLTMFFRNAGNLSGKIGPLPLAFLHALLAVTSFVLLLLFVFA